MKLDILTLVDTIKDIGISGAVAFSGMTGLDAVVVHPHPDSDILIKSIVAIIAGLLTRLLTRLFERRKKR